MSSADNGPSVRKDCTAMIRVRVVKVIDDCARVKLDDDPGLSTIMVPIKELCGVEHPEPPEWSIVSRNGGRDVFVRRDNHWHKAGDGSCKKHTWNYLQAFSGQLDIVRWGLNGDG